MLRGFFACKAAFFTCKYALPLTKWRKEKGDRNDLDRCYIPATCDGSVAVFVLWCGEQAVPESGLDNAGRCRYDHLDCGWICRRGLYYDFVQRALICHFPYKTDQWFRQGCCEKKVKSWMCSKTLYCLWCGCSQLLCVLIYGLIRSLKPAPALRKEAVWRACSFQQLLSLIWLSGVFWDQNPSRFARYQLII